MVVTESISSDGGSSVVARLGAAVERLSVTSRAAALLAAAAISWAAERAVDTPVWCVLLAASGIFLLLAALVDIAEYRLPNALVATAAVTAIAGPAAGGDLRALLTGLLGGLLCGSALLVMHLQRGVGMGDVKAATALGLGCASLTITTAAVALAVGSTLAAVAGLITRRQRLPLGPPLVGGWIVAVLLVGGR